ncbi:MAG: diadenosine tetraphosphatase ApaH/serine/threonine PP2A family protein phosphatase [Verrucomicrobiales bacterium]|jgi:diadenosine tetraphosphatase ApaH/serine/threonine PP2A family protein phosphatase/outer membrane biosynthesis protein TonB
MRYAIFSDIHGNREAWHRVLEDIRALQADVLVCLGDVVGYGPLPEEVLNEIRAETDNFVIGNHDAAAVGLLDASAFNPHASSVIEWTAEQLSEESKEFLTNIPLSIETDDILFVHAEISEPARFGYITDVVEATENFAGSDHFVTFVGHTHDPTIFALDNDGGVSQLPDDNSLLDENHRYIVNVGSVGEPRNPDDLRARYVIYDSETREVFFRRIEFDPEVYRSDLAATSLEVSPYFIQVIDHLIGEAMGESAMAVDMETPAVAPSGFQRQRRLNVPHPDSAAAKPKPLPSPDNFGKKSKTPMILALVGVLVLLVSAIGFWMSAEKKSGPTVANASVPPRPEPSSIPEMVSEPEAPIAPKPEEKAAIVPTPVPKPAAPPAPVPPKPPAPAPKPSKPSEPVRFVRIDLPRKGTLSLAEVQVFSGGQNIAGSGKAKQSSNLSPVSIADLAIDGKTNGVHGNGSVTHTVGQDNPWWELDLDKRLPIERVVVWNRTDCCAERLDNFRLTLLDDRRNEIWQTIATKRPSPNIAFVPEPAREIDEVAWWRMEADSAGGSLIDSRDARPLQAIAAGSAIGGLAPDEIPLTKDLNSGGLTLGIWGEAAPSDDFRISKERSFTLEGWILTDRPKTPIFIAGTRSGKVNDSQGWHVDIRPGSAEAPDGQMSFFYDTGPELIVALSENVAVADLKPHHFAAVWDHASSSEAGELRLFLDGLQIAATQVPHAAIPEKQVNPFRIGAETNPARIAVDEIRFVHTALKPREFLSRGFPPKGVIFVHQFDGPGQQLLSTRRMDQSAVPNRSWRAAAPWTANGSKAKPGKGNSLTWFTPEEGKIYALSMQATLEAGTGAEWFGLGFTVQGKLDDFAGAGASPWMLLRAAPDKDGSRGVGYLGPPNDPKGRFPFPKDLKIGSETKLIVILDTTKPKWKAQWFVGDQAVTPNPIEFLKNPEIKYVGFGTTDKAKGRVRNFRLEVRTP